MSGCFSYESWRVFIRDRRYDFNKTQADNACWGLTSCWGLRTLDGQRTMNAILVEQLREEAKELNQTKEELVKQLTAAQKEMKKMISTEKLRLGGKMDRPNIERLIKTGDKQFNEFLVELNHQYADVKNLKSEVKEINRRLKANSDSVYDVLKVESLFKTGTHVANFSSHVASIKSVIAGKNLNLRSEQNEEGRAMLKEIIDDARPDTSADKSDTLERDDMKELLLLLTSDQVLQSELGPTNEKKVSVKGKGKAVRYAQDMEYSPTDTGTEDDDMFEMESSSGTASAPRGNSGRGVGGGGRSQGSGRGQSSTFGRDF